MSIFYKIASNTSEIDTLTTSFEITEKDSTNKISDDLQYNYMYFENQKKRIINYDKTTGIIAVDSVFENIIYPKSFFEIVDYEGSLIMDEIVELTLNNKALMITYAGLSGTKRTETNKNKIEFESIINTYTVINNNRKRISELRKYLENCANGNSDYSDGILIFKRSDTGNY